MEYKTICAVLLTACILTSCSDDDPIYQCGDYRDGPDCECSLVKGGREMGSNGELCLAWEREYKPYLNLAYARGEAGWWFAIFDEPVGEFFSDTLFFAPISYAELDTSNVPDSTYSWGGFFGELGAYDVGVVNNLVDCSPEVARDSDRTRTLSNLVPRLSSLSYPLYNSGDYWVTTFDGHDWDNDCQFELAIAKGYMDSATSGIGELIWFDREGDEGEFNGVDTISFRLVPIPQDW